MAGFWTLSQLRKCDLDHKTERNPPEVPRNGAISCVCAENPLLLLPVIAELRKDLGEDFVDLTGWCLEIGDAAYHHRLVRAEHSAA